MSDHGRFSRSLARFLMLGLLLTFTAVALSPLRTSGAIPERAASHTLMTERSDSLFDLGVQQYDAGQFVEARWIFENLTRNLSADSRWQVASRLMLARSLYRLEDYPAADAVGQSLVHEPSATPQSAAVVAQKQSYLPHARYLLALTSWKRQAYAQAAKYAYPVATGVDTPPELAAEARLICLAAFARTDSSEFASSDVAFNEFRREATTLGNALALYNASRMALARMTLERIERTYPGGAYTREVAALLDEVRSYERTEIRLAIVAPLSGPDSLAGADLVSGVSFAVERLAPPGLSPLITRSAATQVETIHAVEEMARDSTVLAIIGPLTTDNSIVAGAVANSQSIPIVTPTASGDGLCGIGPNVFQINLTPNVQGRVLAAVTKDSLHAVTVAILASSDASDAALVSEFVRALRNSRVKIIANETFAPGTTDLTRQLTRIRRAALSLVPLPPDVDTVRSMPEVSIDVMLVCSSRETDLISVAAQIPTQKIWTRIVGNASWGSPSVRLQAGEAAEGVVFATTYDFSYREAREFAQAYQMARGSESSIVTALSYDAASLALQAISTGARNRSQVREFLGNVQNWPGVTGMITFSPDGCNGEAMVRMIRGGRVQPVSDWQLLAAQQPQSE